MQIQVFPLCGTLRVIHAFALQTYFNPDEYWQCLEPAHLLAFGYGHITWEWAAGLRGYLHPVLFALLYKVLQIARMDTSWAVAKAPQLLQAGFAAVTDVYVYKLALLLFGNSIARWTLLCQLTNWFNAYCLVRTYSNSLEAPCTIMGVFYWLKSTRTLLQPVETLESSQQAQVQGIQAVHHTACQQHDQPKVPHSLVSTPTPSVHNVEQNALMTHRQKALWAAAIGVLFRPSSVLFWVPLGVHELRVCRAKFRFVLDAVLIGGSTLLIGSLIDRSGYGRWVLVPWEFAKFNLIQAGSAMYGSHPWHWNFTQGLPTITLTMLPLAGWGVYLTPDRLALAGLVLWSLLIYSLPAHKEFRFLLPALQLLMPYCGVALHYLNRRWGCPSTPADVIPHQAHSSKVRANTLHSQKGSAGEVPTFSLDRSAVHKARQLSRLLDEATPQEGGGCPFMALTDDALQPARGSNSRVCPYSTGRAPGTQESRAPDTRTQESKAPDTQESRGPDAFPYHSRAPGSHAQENSAYNADDTTCPSTSDKAFTDTPAQESSFPDAEGTTCPFRATPAVVTPTPKPAAHGDLQSSCLSSSHSDGPPQVTQSKAAGKCPFHFEPSTSSPLLSSALPQPAPAPAAAEVEHELPGMSAMTDEALREYEQAFAVDPDEAMLRAYGALLADKVAEACGQADDSSKSDAEGRQGREFECTAAQPSTPPPGCTPKQPTLPAHGLAPSRLAHASPLVQRYESETRASKAPQASSHATCAQIAEADSAAAATQTNNMTNRSSGLHAVTAHSKAAVMAAFACQGVHDACQHSMNRVSACRDFLQQQPLRWHLLMTACLGLQLVMMLYFSLFHQRGQIDVMHYLAKEAQQQPTMKVLFLTPCHATPWFSHVHANITMDFLDCSPPGWAEATRCLNRPGCNMHGLDTSDRRIMPPQHEYGMFRDEPLKVLQSRWRHVEKSSMPTHLVMFQDLVPAVSRYIAGQGFALRKTLFNCHFQVDAGSRIWVWKQSRQTPSEEPVCKPFM